MLKGAFAKQSQKIHPKAPPPQKSQIFFPKWLKMLKCPEMTKNGHKSGKKPKRTKKNMSINKNIYEYI